MEGEWLSWEAFSRLETLLSFILMVAGLVVAAWKRKALWRWLRGGQPGTDNDAVIDKGIRQKVDACKGVVISFSRADQAEWLIDRLGPHYVAIITSAESKFYDDALGLEENLHMRGIHVNVVKVKNAYDIHVVESEVRHAVENLIDQGVPSDQIIVDITGGTKPMGLGAYFASQALGVQATYIQLPFAAPGKPIKQDQKLVPIT